MNLFASHLRHRRLEWACLARRHRTRWPITRSPTSPSAIGWGLRRSAPPSNWATTARLEGVGGATELVYDIDSELTIALDRDATTVRVWTYDSEGETWDRKGLWEIGAISESAFLEPPQAAFDPLTGLVLVRDQFTSGMWTYDVDTDTCTEVDQGGTLPPVVEGPNDPAVELLTYDASADRLILYVSKPLGTWEFDIRAGRWNERETDTPETGFGWFATGEELAYDEANERSVLFSFGTIATYDASEHRWNVLQGEGTDVATARLYFAMTFDPVNDRTWIAGGEVRTFGTDWRPTDEAIAVDAATGGWITLLGPGGGQG